MLAKFKTLTKNYKHVSNEKQCVTICEKCTTNILKTLTLFKNVN